MKIKELLHAIMPYSLKKFLVTRQVGFNKQDKILIDSRIALYPPTFDLRKVVDKIDKSVAFLPYCAKAKGECPLSNGIHGRKNQKCIRLSGGRCKVQCSLGKMVDVLKAHGYGKDQIFIIDSDSNLFPWLKKKKEEGYKYVFPGVACYYGVGYALNFIGKELGYEGCIVLLDDYNPEDKKYGLCRSFFNYLNMNKMDKGNKTKICNKSIKLIEKILNGEYP